MVWELGRLNREAPIRVYERLAEAGRKDAPLRPGGLGLTVRALSLCALPQGSAVLDVGCGSGVSIQYLSSQLGFKTLGVDPSSLLLSQGRQRDAMIPLVRADGERLPLGGGRWDAVLLECSLSVAKDAVAVLNECGRVLKPGGFLVMSDVYLRHPWPAPGMEYPASACCLQGAMTRNDLEVLLECNHFKVLWWEDHSTALKEFLAELILSDIPMESLQVGFPFSQTGPAGRCGFWEPRWSRRFGYFLLLARQSIRHGGGSRNVEPGDSQSFGPDADEH